MSNRSRNRKVNAAKTFSTLTDYEVAIDSRIKDSVFGGVISLLSGEFEFAEGEEVKCDERDETYEVLEPLAIRSIPQIDSQSYAVKDEYGTVKIFPGEELSR